MGNPFLPFVLRLKMLVQESVAGRIKCARFDYQDGSGCRGSQGTSGQLTQIGWKQNPAEQQWCQRESAETMGFKQHNKGAIGFLFMTTKPV